jgi:hypothetical protein
MPSVSLRKNIPSGFAFLKMPLPGEYLPVLAEKANREGTVNKKRSTSHLGTFINQPNLTNLMIKYFNFYIEFLFRSIQL